MGELTEKYAKQLHHHCLWDMAMHAQKFRIPKVPGLLRRSLRAIYGADLPLWTRRPDDVCLMHSALGTVIHADTKFLGPAIIFHQVTIGNVWTARQSGEGAPTIGRYVFVGAGAKVLGGIRIGDHVVIGANALVTRDVPDGHAAVGAPAVLRPISRERMLATYFGLTE